MLLYLLLSVTLARLPQTRTIIITNEGDKGCCSGTYERTINETGWNKLTIATSEECSDDVQAYCMGFLEGYITSEDIDAAWNNYRFNHWEDGIPPEEIVDMYNDQFEFWHNAGSGETWRRQKLIQEQFAGLCNGYKEAGGKMTAEDMYILYNSGDLYDLNDFYPSSQNSLASMRKRYGKMNIHSCSAFVRNVNDTVYFAHNTWDLYTEMLRTYKVYETHFGEKRTIAMASYPGLFCSIDDFYSVNTKDSTFFVMATTNNIYYEEMTFDLSDKLLYQQRIMQSLLFEDTAENIGKGSCVMNSGTYNNQWMIFDAGKWNQKQRQQVFYVTESMPGVCNTHDVSNYLTQGNGTWVSYNIPYDKEVYNASGLYDMLKDLDCNAYYMSRRRQIFERDIHKVVDFESAKMFIRSNDFRNDPLCTKTSECTKDFNSTTKKDPCYAISARKDLDDDNPELYGARDAAILTTKNVDVMYLINGPTTEGQPVFDFEQVEGYDFYIEGMPTRYDFGWVQMQTIRYSINGAIALISNSLITLVFCMLFL